MRTHWFFVGFLICIGNSLIFSSTFAQKAKAPPKPLNCQHPENKKERNKCFMAFYKHNQEQSTAQANREEIRQQKKQLRKDRLNARENKRKKKEKRLLKKRIRDSKARNRSNKGKPYKNTFGHAIEPREK